MAVVTFTMHRTPVTLPGLEPARVTPHAANDNLTQLTGHARPCLMATSDIPYSSNSTRQLAPCILASSWRCS